MGKQEGTVRGLQFRAIAALRRQLGIEEPESTTAPAHFEQPEDQLMDDHVRSRDSGAIELARRLEAFAEARLTPSVAVDHACCAAP